jgi:kumamolisin
MLVTLALLSSRLVAQKPDEGFKYFNDSIVKLPAGEQANVVALSNDSLQRRLELHFALETNNIGDLEARVAKGEVVSPGEMKDKYSGNEESFNALVAWLKSHGFKITQVSPDHANVYASAKISTIEKNLGVTMETVTYKGITTPAATTAPRLPLDIGNHVIAIGGLQPFIQAVKHSVARDDDAQENAPQKTPSVSRPATATQPRYMVKDILRAYSADGLGVTGSGQVIAILIDTFPAMDDLKTFWQKNALAVNPAQIQLINVQGTQLPAREGEETLDVEWSSGIAPGATIRVYASGSLEYTYLDRAFDQIYADAQTTAGLRHVSVSLGLREDLLSPGEIQAEHAMFLKLAALGATVFVSSGDAGSNPDKFGKPKGPDPPQVEYEASDSFTLAVGGTTLLFDQDQGKVLGETAWARSGGGASNLFPRPPWQTSYAPISGSHRLVPDVSSVADPNPGAFIWYQGAECSRGGTSWSTPVWAGLNSLIAEARQKQGKQPIGFLAPALYKLSSGFRDITVGSNGKYQAGVGWDPVTGLGVPNVKGLLVALH